MLFFEMSKSEKNRPIFFSLLVYIKVTGKVLNASSQIAKCCINSKRLAVTFCIGLVATLWQICLKFRFLHAPKMYSAPWPDTAELRLRGAIHAAKLSLY